MGRTTSTERDYRFFNFAFACVYVWQLIDLLMKLALDGENRTYKPLVDANQFLTGAKQWSVSIRLTNTRSSRVRPVVSGGTVLGHSVSRHDQLISK